MDPLTHALTGAALADALPLPSPGRRGLLFAMAMGAAPDLDLVPAFVAKLPHNLIPGRFLFDSSWMRLHRGITHSLFFAVVFGIAAGWIFWRLGIKKGNARCWCLIAVLALLSHAALDLLNGGVALWLPFSDEWVSWADLPVLDFPTLGLLAFCFIANRPPPAWRDPIGPEGKLEKAWRNINQRVGIRYGTRRTARICLLIAAAIIVARILL